jgi:tetratricopeptide (TPR) repeat protein
MISWAAINRIVERRRASDAEYRRQTAGRPVRSDAERLTDGELLARLRSFDITLDRPTLERLSDQALSAEEIVAPLLDQRTFATRREELGSDWIWICVTALWHRWFPDKPSFEMLDDRIQAGYDLLEQGESVAACRIWLEAWADALRLLDKAGTQSIEAFDNRFRGTQSLFNWIQDLEDELWNAGQRDRQFLAARIAVCEEGLRRFAADDALLTENRRRALAESYFALGETGKAEALYREWLQADPAWGWGWIGWSDCYRFGRPEGQDLARAEQLLRQGLAVAGVRDRHDLADRLADLYDELGRAEEAQGVRRQAEESLPAITRTHEVRLDGNVLREKATVTFGGEGLPLSELPKVAARLGSSPPPGTLSSQKVGRNDPCPCGSGKKFKKCCGGLGRTRGSAA